MNFSQDQLDVIGIESGYNMVLAGPGCGKTEILAERIAQAYERGKVEPEDILCLTFTNRAARGMYKRIQERLQEKGAGLFVGNIHRFCSHFLFSNALVPEDTFIIDEDDTEEIVGSEISDEEVKSIIGYTSEFQDYRGGFYLMHVNWGIINTMPNIDIHPSGSTGTVREEKANKIIKQAREKILQLTHVLMQMRGGHPAEDLLHGDLVRRFMEHAGHTSLEEFAKECAATHYEASEFEGLTAHGKALALADKLLNYKESHHLLDFDDLLIRTYDAYLHDKEREFKRYPWVQVDEIQDLSRFQISLVDLMSENGEGSVTLYLGDEQQAIYSFMGASLDTLNYLKVRCQDNIYRLYRNYRSPKYLLDIYNDYAADELKVDRALLPTSDNESAGQRYDVCLHVYDSMGTETERICHALLPYLRQQSEQETTAILVPWNRDATELSDQLNLDQVPHFKISGADTFQSASMRTLLSHFNVISNEYNDVAWSRLLKLTEAVDTHSRGRAFVERARDCAMTPADLLLYDNGDTYLSRFCQKFDRQTIVLFDTETTGVDVYEDDIVQIAAMKIRNGEIVPGSEFCIFLQTEKETPEMLGSKVNPMKEAYEREVKLPRDVGLLSFIEYIGDCDLMGHNVNFDYNILLNNLQRDCPQQQVKLEGELVDTLKLAHLLFPNLHKYKLEYLLEKFQLDGANSHMADDDIIATYEVAKFFKGKADRFLNMQQDFLRENATRKVMEKFELSYKKCYLHTLQKMHEENGESIALTEEMKYVYEFLRKEYGISPINIFDIILEFLKQEVIQDEPNILHSQLGNHLIDLCTYREADLCDSNIFKVKLFISTVHKAKGLEFDNVIVMRAVQDRYPSFAHKTAAEQDEDKRLFYVALSRAKKRLVVSTSDSPNVITPYIAPIVRHFCVRFVFWQKIPTGQFLTVSAEIFKDGLSLAYKYNGKTIQYVFPTLQELYKREPGLSDPLVLRNLILAKAHEYEYGGAENIVNYLKGFGIVPL